jgi:hypothetical protein
VSLFLATLGSLLGDLHLFLATARNPPASRSSAPKSARSGEGTGVPAHESAGAAPLGLRGGEVHGSLFADSRAKSGLVSVPSAQAEWSHARGPREKKVADEVCTAHLSCEVLEFAARVRRAWKNVKPSAPLDPPFDPGRSNRVSWECTSGKGLRA